MINKKNVLGKPPHELGTKDAIHTAIVSVRAATLIKPGQRCGLNEHREAVPDAKGPGVADPFLKCHISRGEVFWLMLNQEEIPNVHHVWEHPTVDFSPPAREVKLNPVLAGIASDFGVTYQQLMDAAAHVVEKESSAPYQGTKTAEEVETALEELSGYELWSEWADETGFEFADEGTACCPEPVYPYERLFSV
jgi:hypothetical protein